jgi:hypothetical protein
LLPEGPHRFELVCNETDPDVRFHTYLSVLALGGTP